MSTVESAAVAIPERSRLTAAPTDCVSAPSFQDGSTEGRNEKQKDIPGPAALGVLAQRSGPCHQGQSSVH